MKRLLGLAMFALPLLYISSILAVSIHEIIGHGLTAQLLGGSFNGATVKLDGMGWADIEPGDLSSPALTLMYLGGATCTGLLALLFFGLGIVRRFTPLLRFSFVLFGFGFLLDGFPYYFWDGILMGGIGDFSMIWNLYPSNSLRGIIVAMSGIGLLAGIVIFNAVFYRCAGRILGQSFLQTRKNRFALSTVMLAVQAICWFVFDWNQIVPGVGLLPSITGIVIALVTLIVMEIKGFVPKTEDLDAASRSLMLPLIGAWATCAGTILVVALWLQNGI